MGSGLSKKASVQHVAEKRESNKETTLVSCNCDKEQLITNSNEAMTSKAICEPMLAEHSSLEEQSRVEKWKPLNGNKLPNETVTTANTQLTHSIKINKDQINQCGFSDETPHNNHSSSTVMSKVNGPLETNQMSHANKHVSVTHTSIEEIESDTTPLDCSVKRPTLFKINPLTPPSLSLIAARQESSTTPLYRKTRKSSWGQNNKSNLTEHVSSADNALCKHKLRNQEDVDSLMSLSSDVSSEIEKEENEKKRKETKEECVQEQKESQTNHKSMDRQTKTESNHHNNIDQSNMLSEGQEECTRHTIHTNHALRNVKDNNNDDDDDFVLFPSLQTRHNWRHSSSLVSNESTSFITATSSCNTNTNTDLNTNINTSNNNNGAAFKSEFPLFFVRPSIATSSSVPTSSEVLDTPLNSRSDHRFTYTSGSSAAYLLDPPSLNSYIERHAKLIHSTSQSNPDEPLGNNECVSMRSNSGMKSTDHSLMAEVPPMETLLNCSFDSRAFANLSKSLRVSDFIHNIKQRSEEDDSNDNCNKRSSCNLGVSNTTMHNTCRNGISNEAIKEGMSASQSNEEIEIIKTHAKSKLFCNAEQEMSHSENKATTMCQTTQEKQTHEITINECHGNIACNEGADPVNDNIDNDKTERNTNDAMEMVDFLSHFVHEPANKESNSVHWFRTTVERCRDVDNSGNNNKEINSADRPCENIDDSNINTIRERLRQRREQRKNRLCNTRKENSMYDSTHNISWEPYEYNEADDWEDNITNYCSSNTEKYTEENCQHDKTSESHCTSAHCTKLTLSLTSSGKWKAMPISPILLTPLSGNNSSHVADEGLHLIDNNKKVNHESHKGSLPADECATNLPESPFYDVQCDGLSMLHNNKKNSHELEEEHPLQHEPIHHHHHRHHHHCLCDGSPSREKEKHKAHKNEKNNKHKKPSLLPLSSSSSSSSLEESFTSELSFESSSSSELSETLPSLCKEPHTISEKTSKPSSSPRSSGLLVVECAECSKRSPQINVIVPPSVSLSHLSRVNNESSAHVSRPSSFTTSVSYPNDMNHIRSIEADEAILNPLNEMTEFVATQCYECDMLGPNRELGMCTNVKTNSLNSANNGSDGSSSNDMSKSDIDKRIPEKGDDLEYNESTIAERIREEGNPFFCPSDSKCSSNDTFSSLRYKANSPLLTASSSLPMSSTSSSSLEELEHTSPPCSITIQNTPKISFIEVHNSMCMNSTLVHDNPINFTMSSVKEPTSQQSKNTDYPLNQQVETSVKDESLLHTHDNTTEQITESIRTIANISHIRKHRKPIISASIPFKEQLAKRADEDYELFVMFRRKGNTVLKHNVVDDTLHNDNKNSCC